MAKVKPRSFRSHQNQRDPTFLAAVVVIGFILFVCIRVSAMSSTTDSTTSQSKIYTNLQDLINSKVHNDFDAILVLGGGVPSSLYEPPLYVQQRCDDAAAIRNSNAKETPILTLSAGTAHLPQLLTTNGMPIWESTSSAAYLQQTHQIRTNLYLETTSYDTIGNAFFARISHADIIGWRNLCIITNDFHMDRTRAIFDWIFGIVDHTKKTSRHQKYRLTYFASPSVGLLTDEAQQARQVHEQKSTQTVLQKLAPHYRTLPDVYKFIHENHDLYTADKLISGATEVNAARNDALKASYGGGAGK